MFQAMPRKNRPAMLSRSPISEVMPERKAEGFIIIQIPPRPRPIQKIHRKMGGRGFVLRSEVQTKESDWSSSHSPISPDTKLWSKEGNKRMHSPMAASAPER